MQKNIIIHKTYTLQILKRLCKTTAKSEYLTRDTHLMQQFIYYYK